MARNTEVSFVDTNADALVSMLVSAYEKITKIAVHPASPERLFIQWIANILVQERVLTNYAGNQNIPSRAEGENLDALGELFLASKRPAAQAAVCTVRFTISAEQPSVVVLPAGTRVTDSGNTLIWETTADNQFPVGETKIDVPVRCQTAGIIGNGYAAGQINTLIDLYEFCAECTNITQSDGGSDEATDEEYYQLMRASMDAYSCAGAKGSYIYFAKQVSTEIIDVVANSPQAGTVKLYVLMEGGTLATEEMKNAVLARCSADEVRPLTDKVSVEDAEIVSYNIAFTYYLQSGSTQSAAEIADAVNAAVAEYTAWQCAKLGRDINPSHLIGLLMRTGIKRVELTSPVFTDLRDGGAVSENAAEMAPQVAKIGTITITNGGYEDE